MVPSLPMVGDELAGYRLRGVLGRGGMSVVFEAENPRLGSTVALKVLAPELATDDVFRARFLKESRTAASLNHPNVIPIYDMGAHEDLLYIAMRYVAGADLRAVLKAQQRISPAQALLLVGQTGRALDAAHRRGLVHRDVKPGNILIEHASDDEPDHVYLTDFGITKHSNSKSGLTATGEFMGTIDYIAPEQIKGKDVDGRADIYSLGCVLYETLTGRVPFMKDLDAAVIWAHVEEMPTEPSAIQRDLPRGIDDVIGRALAKDPSERYATCRELVDAAQATLLGTTPDLRTATVLTSQSAVGEVPPQAVSAGPPDSRDRTMGSHQAPPREPSGPSRRGWFSGPRRIAAIAGALVLIIAAGIGYWVTSGGKASAHTVSASKSGMPSHSASPMPNHLVSALAQANTATRGLVPAAKCHPQGSSVDNCSHPHFAVDKVTFHTYPSQAALYNAYVAAVRSLGNRMGSSIQTNFADCSQVTASGEVSWNHNHLHPKSYSLAQSRAGMLRPADQSAGRLFCTLIGSQYYLVWTQDSGHMLGQLSGAPHEDAWQWWHAVHHNIVLSGQPMHM
jgi:serine/threonine protein kinase